MIYGHAPSVFLFLQQFSFVVWEIPFIEYQKQVYDNTQACTFPLVEKENSKINTRTQVIRSLLDWLPRSPQRTKEIEAVNAPLPGTNRRSWDPEARSQLARGSVFDV